MLYWIWLPIVAIRNFISSYWGIDTLLITIFLNLILLIDFIIIIQKDNYNVNYLFVFFIISIVIIVLNKAALAFFDVLMAVYILKTKSINSLLKHMLISSIAILVLYLFLFSIGINENIIVPQPKGITHTLGFNNTNSASAFFMIHIMVISLYLYTKNKLWKGILKVQY